MDNEDSPVNPKTYSSELIEFLGGEKQRLQALQHIDPSLSEIFFGSYPILVEGDTEHAAFIAAIVEKKHELLEKVTIVRARGKAILVPLIKVMQHFKIDFGLIHDCDTPFKKNGDNNGMWTENGKIREAIKDARSAGILVRHRVNIPDFERSILKGGEESKDKPLNAYRSISTNDELGLPIQNLLKDLFNADQHEPFPNDLMDANTDNETYLKLLRQKVVEWAHENGTYDDPRFSGKNAE